ncbi:fumarylacetoacetate hydrolase family protein [Herbaspirillum autotrophicum]|uniref:fumarylacetoacetate hydrolase family protein n=1 Tax=Herbaspirillum autotrophicum TaxID=180195 RepID=UPI00067A7F1E|nr:fumarylacetoacetate hydrolase family protein [Herbaspirillum autotrophicum]
MTTYLFPPSPIPAIPVAGSNDRYPVRRIFCVGRNYEAHAKEMGVQVDREAPFYFTKAADTYVPSGASISYPPGTSNYHYEMELVAVIGKAGFEIPREQALEHVFGYACGLDMTRRDLQLAAREQRRPWDLGKDVEQSAVISAIVPAQQCGHPSSGAIELRVNGEQKQSSDLSLLIHGISDLIAHLSRYYHLTPGDVIFTGTPEGVGPVVAGDHIAGSIAGLGDISLTIQAA